MTEPNQPVNPEIQQQKTEPNQPVNPEIQQQKIEPTEPVNPEIKQQKIEPTEPIKPEIKQQKIEPTEPINPEIQQQKTEPTEPINPEIKQQKTEPTEPINQEISKQKYEYDPHLDPQLNWAGKTEHTSFEVPTVSLHVHEKIDPYSIIEAIKNPDYNPEDSFVSEIEEEPPKKPSKEKKLTFYQHQKNWSNRLITGDSLLIMNSLLHKEGMAGKVQTIYIDPPYGIKYGSNFQPFVNNRDVKNGSDEDLTQSPETIKAFRDTWELGVHSYLTYLRDRLLLARELLDETGSCFVQISEANVHFVRNLMDEVFGRENLCSEISFIKATGLTARLLKRVSDYIIWYAKSKKYVKYRQLYKDKMDLLGYTHIEMPDGTVRTLSTEERIRPTLLPPEGRPYRTDNLSSAGGVVYTCLFDYTFQGKTYSPPQNRSWKTNPQGMEVLEKAGRLIAGRQSLRFLKYADDLTVSEVDNLWTDTGGPSDKTYVVQTSRKVIQRCMLMTTDPGDLVLDITCGSGTTAYVAEQWGRRWITCDTSRVAITLAKQRLMTGVFDFYQLTNPTEGISSGFKYKTVPHITLKSITNNPEIREGMTREEITKALRKYALIETLYDRPFTDKSQIRVSGPFTVEAVPSPVVKSVDKIVPEEINNEENGHNSYPKIEPDFSIVRTGETLRQAEWREELLKTGIRAKNAQKIEFSSVEPLPGTQFLHALAETKEYPHQRVVISFGYEYAPLEKTQIQLAISEAKQLVPQPEMIVFAAFEFDPEAARNIDEINSEGLRLLKVQINGDLLTEDLKKKRATNESFWLLGQPDVKLQKIGEITDKEVYQVEVLGFDYYNTKTGKIESGGKAKIAMWLLDTDYNGSCMFAKQVFFPMGGYRDGLDKLAKSLKAEIDEDLFAVYRSTVSRPFELGKYRRVAVKIVDDRGLESLKVIKVN
jgi:adenine-specific DNA-methyltransferase